MACACRLLVARAVPEKGERMIEKVLRVGVTVLLVTSACTLWAFAQGYTLLFGAPRQNDSRR